MRKTPRGWIQIGESRTRGVARIPLGLKPSRDSRATSQRDSPIWIQPLGVFRYKIQPFISSLWQERWDEEVDNKLHAIMPQIDENYYSGCTNRKDEVIINRLRIGHMRLTHSFRMENRPHPPLCDQCEGNHYETYFNLMQFPENHSSATLWRDWFKSAL